MRVWLKRAGARLLFLSARVHFLFSQSMDRQFILIGEKDGWQARDNAYHLFRYLYESGRRDVFFVARRRNADANALSEFGESVVAHNSFRHYYMLLRSRLMIMNDGYYDVYPHIPGILAATHEPFYYLQHGILRYKKVYFNSGHYYGRILRFEASTKAEADIVQHRMMPRQVEKELERIHAYLYLMGAKIDPFNLQNFSEIADKLKAAARAPSAPKAAAEWMTRSLDVLSQLRFQVGFPANRIAPFGLPRHDRLIARMGAGAGTGRMIVLFLTWRDYWRQRGSDEQLRSQPFFQIVREIVDDERVVDFLSPMTSR